MIQIRTGMPSASYQQHLKDQNATLLFDLVRRRAPISRAELTKASGLSAATVTVLVDELLQGGWLVELGAVGSTARGRRPINLAVNAARGAVATLEILSDGSILSVYDICLHKLTQTRSRLPGKHKRADHRTAARTACRAGACGGAASRNPHPVSGPDRRHDRAVEFFRRDPQLAAVLSDDPARFPGGVSGRICHVVEQCCSCGIFCVSPGYGAASSAASGHDRTGGH